MAEEKEQDQVSFKQLQTDLEAVTNLLKRSVADFENYKRRKEAENKELVEFAKEVAVAKLLPTLDSLEQALKHKPQYTVNSTQNTEFEKKYEMWQSGISAILSQLGKALGELGVKKIEAVGKKFDPNLHEAIREIEGEEDGVVAEEFQTGFELNGKVIRPSQVSISKKKSNY